MTFRGALIEQIVYEQTLQNYSGSRLRARKCRSVAGKIFLNLIERNAS